MRTPNYWSISILLFALAMPVFVYAASGGSNSWFHIHQGSSPRPQHQNNHPVVKHYIASHPKPLRTKNIHTRTAKRNKHS